MALRLPAWNFSGLCGFGQQWGPLSWAAAGLGCCGKIRVHTWCPWGPALPSHSSFFSSWQRTPPGVCLCWASLTFLDPGGRGMNR